MKNSGATGRERSLRRPSRCHVVTARTPSRVAANKQLYSLALPHVGRHLAIDGGLAGS
jgi:hypothetical protein